MRPLPSLLLLASAAALTLPAKEKIMTLSWGDVIWQHQGQGNDAVDTPKKMREAIRGWKANGVTKVHFRVDDFRILGLKRTNE